MYIHARSIRINAPIAPRHEIKKVSDRSLTQTLVMQGGRCRKTALYDDAIAFACVTVTDRAIDIEAFMSPLEQQAIDRNGKFGCERRSRQSCDQRAQFDGIVLCHGMFDRRWRCGTVGKKSAAAERFIFRLIIHVLTATR